MSSAPTAVEIVRDAGWLAQALDPASGMLRIIRMDPEAYRNASFLDDGSTTEEWKLCVETKKILDPKIKLTATCVRVPVFVGHSEAVNIEFENEISADEARSILREAPGVMVVDKRENGGYVTPVEAVGEYATYVSRIREDSTIENGLSLWIVSDNLRKGAALNAVQIAELLGRKHLQKAA
jgi:aspartate-semialdehyde dehydrogenase